MATPAPTLFSAIHHPKKRAVLAAYAASGRIIHACTSANMGHAMHYYWLRTDPAYAAAFKEAHTMVANVLEEEAVRRAVGYEEIRYTADGQPYPVIKQSDTLLIFLLKGAKPEKYRDNIDIHHEVSGEVTLTWSDRLSRAHTSLEERRVGHLHVA